MPPTILPITNVEEPFLSTIVGAQKAQLIPWQLPAGDPREGLAYRPEPILFIHGVNANDAGWNTALETFEPIFEGYDISQTIITFTQLTNGLNAMQYPYLQTFNYGDPPNANQHSHNRQTFDPVKWNAWEGDLHGAAETNFFHNPEIWGPLTGDNRTTLDMRIDDIRTAYSITINDNTIEPDVVLVAHSLGALLSHHYMLKSGTDSGVRRFITVAGAHQGSLLANWLTWYRAYGYPTTSYDHHAVGPVIRWARSYYPTHNADLIGLFKYWNQGAVQNALMINQNPVLVFTNSPNPFLQSFWNTPAPKIEYVFNAYQMPVAPAGASPFQDLRTLIDDAGIDPVFDRGDGFVPIRSAAGKDGSNSPSIWNGSTNVNANIHSIDPVIFGIWLNIDHTGAATNIGPMILSLDGVPYNWPGSTSSQWPSYAHYYGENQSFSKYYSNPVDATNNSIAYTDEPGIGDLHLQSHQAGENALLIPSINTFGTNGAGRTKMYTNATDFAGHQIIGSSDASVRYNGIAGAKNYSQTPAIMEGTNYWIQDGNEYLPASLSIQVNVSSAANSTLLTTNAFSAITGSISNCLVWFDSAGNPQYQYRYFQSTSSETISANTNYYVAAQGYNFAGLLTPQTEQAFNVPVDSATVVEILTNVNAGEVMSNACFGPLPITLWTNSINEWVRSGRGTIILNFYPTSTSLNISDAWTGTNFIDFTYDSGSATITIDDTNTAPSQLIVSYMAYVGSAQSVMTNYPGGASFTIPAINTNTLAGMPVDVDSLTYYRGRVENVLSRFRNTTTNGCIGWTLTNILAAVGNNSGTWSIISNDVVTAQLFTELSNVANQLTDPATCCCAYVTINLTPSNTNGTYAFPNATSNVLYNSASITASSGTETQFTFSITSGGLPPGLVITNLTSSSISITGTPTTFGCYTFGIGATNANGCATNALYSIYFDSCCTCGQIGTNSVILTNFPGFPELASDVALYRTGGVCQATCSTNETGSYECVPGSCGENPYCFGDYCPIFLTNLVEYCFSNTTAGSDSAICGTNMSGLTSVYTPTMADVTFQDTNSINLGFPTPLHDDLCAPGCGAGCTIHGNPQWSCLINLTINDIPEPGEGLVGNPQGAVIRCDFFVHICGAPPNATTNLSMTSYVQFSNGDASPYSVDEQPLTENVQFNCHQYTTQLGYQISEDADDPNPEPLPCSGAPSCPNCYQTYTAVWNLKVGPFW